jgi:predicted exporter
LSEGVLSVFRDEAFSLLALGSGVILLLLAAFRYPLLGIARIFLVLALSIVITMAMLSLAGEKLTMLHILAALLVVGLGLDYTIFFSWPDADEQQRSRTRQALLVCMASTVLVFGLLAGSAIDLLRAIGLTVALGAGATFAAAYAILSRHDD